MSARQSLALLAAMSALVLASLTVLAWRLDPCLPRGRLCPGSDVNSLCRLLMVAGLDVAPRFLGPFLLATTLLLPVGGLLSTAHRWYRTALFLSSLGRRSTRPLPNRLAAAAQAVGLAGRLDLIETPSPLAFVHGLLQPRVWVSTGLVDQLAPAELDAVLRHEWVHLARRDPLRTLLGQGLATTLCWLPLARDLAAHVPVACEVEADAAVTRQRPDGRIALARALGKLLTATTAVGPRFAISGLTATERRIDALLEGKTRASFACSTSGVVLSAILLLVLICLVLF